MTKRFTTKCSNFTDCVQELGERGAGRVRGECGESVGRVWGEGEVLAGSAHGEGRRVGGAIGIQVQPGLHCIKTCHQAYCCNW